MNRFAALRSMAEQFMTDQCTISESSSIEYLENLGHEVDTPGTVVYAGKCRIRPASGPVVLEVGEGVRSEHRYWVWLPYDVVTVNRNHVVTITVSDDPYLIDRTFVVRDIEGGSEGPHRKLEVEDTLSVSDEVEEVGS